jgi:hypothetical protein
VQPRHVQPLIAPENAIGRPEQHDKQTELAIAESNELSGRRLQAPRIEVRVLHRISTR